MTQSTADLIQGWHAECALLDQKIAGIRTGRGGSYLSLAQKEAAIQDLIETAAECRSLIDEFSKFEAFSVAFHKTDRNEREPVVRRRFCPKRHVASELAPA